MFCGRSHQCRVPFWILGIVCGALRRLKKKRKRGIHLIVRVKDLKKKTQEDAPFFSQKELSFHLGRKRQTDVEQLGLF